MLPENEPILDPTLRAVELFWAKRTKQMSELADGGLSGGGARAAKHMKGVQELVAQIFVQAGMPESSIVHEPYLPGYYRARKKWDLAICYKDTLVAALEFKSQVGSVGKNISNRFEEALGSSTDLWAAHKHNAAYGEIPPWLGYVLILREDEETEKANRSTKALFPVDEAFVGMSYNQRYREMLSRFIGDNVYQAGWFITTKSDVDGSVSYKEPLATASGKSFRAAVQGRVDFIKSVLD